MKRNSEASKKRRFSEHDGADDDSSTTVADIELDMLEEIKNQVDKAAQVFSAFIKDEHGKIPPRKFVNNIIIQMDIADILVREGRAHNPVLRIELLGWVFERSDYVKNALVEYIKYNPVKIELGDYDVIFKLSLLPGWFPSASDATISFFVEEVLQKPVYQEQVFEL